jgi:ATP-dependent exoDNAse (exonuclease V) alpha subunit
MVRVDLMDAMDRALRRYRNMPQVPFGGVRVIMIGDLFQLPPVAQDEDAETLLHHYKGLFFHHAPAVEEMNLELFELTKVYRQRDKIFSSALTRIRAAQQTQHDMDLINRRVVDGLSVRPKERATYIVFTNSKANAVNEMFLQQIEGEVFESRVILSGNATISRVPCEELVRFKIGAQIIFISNDAGGRWQNGRIGKIVGVRGEIVQVELTNNNVIDVPKYDFIVWDYVLKDNNLERIESGSARQYPFKLGWAITAHKSQGQTFDCVHIDISDTQAFADGQMYVALSRCSSLKNLTLSRRIYAQEIRSNTESLAFLAKLRQATS